MSADYSKYQNLYRNQLSLWDTIEKPESYEIHNKRVAITGNLAGCKRCEAILLIEAAGGIYTTCVSNRTDYLVLGDLRPSKGTATESRKLKTAKQMIKNNGKIAIITIEEFFLSVGLEWYNK